ncbi:MAG TPA: glycosyltransferase family 1 protein [Longimicrobium sp.]|nr:glycosyltransferase family 1 protein [Longimicrobium sp.]
MADRGFLNAPAAPGGVPGVSRASVARHAAVPLPVSLGVDARGLYATGIGRYTREVLAGVLSDPRFGAITLLGDPAELERFVDSRGRPPRVSIVPYTASWFTRRTQVEWLSLWRAGKTRADVWFFPSADVPLAAHPRRSVATIHDIIETKLPHLAGLKGRLASRVMLRGSTWRAHRVIAVSEATRRDVVEHVPSAARKAVVVHQGVSPDFFPLRAGEALPPAVAALRPYLLCVGNRAPHKNHAGAVEALARVRAERPDVRLVIAGGRNDGSWHTVLDRAARLGVADALVDLGGVSDAELRLLYAGAEALLFPSLYEGFGLPVLEAMACGAPVVAGNRSSVPEVAGDAALLVDPADPAALARSVLRLMGDPALRSTLSTRGVAQAARFPWSATASRTAEILLGAAASGRA